MLHCVHYNMSAGCVWTINFQDLSVSLLRDIQWNLSKRTLRERDTVLNTSPQWTKPNPQIYPSLCDWNLLKEDNLYKGDKPLEFILVPKCPFLGGSTVCPFFMLLPFMLCYMIDFLFIEKVKIFSTITIDTRHATVTFYIYTKTLHFAWQSISAILCNRSYWCMTPSSSIRSKIMES